MAREQNLRLLHRQNEKQAIGRNVMPLYSYECCECKKVFEALQRKLQQETPVCPGCGSKRVSRMLSMPAKPVVKQSPSSNCCGSRGGCENPKRCCEKR
jgi:putative FmdB family regulatory protein